VIYKSSDSNHLQHLKNPINCSYQKKMAITHPICQKIQQFVNKFLSHSPDGHRHEDTLSKKSFKNHRQLWRR